MKTPSPYILLALFLTSCGLGGSKSVSTGSQYRIENSNSSVIFEILEAAYHKEDLFQYELVEYLIYKEGLPLPDPKIAKIEYDVSLSESGSHSLRMKDRSSEVIAHSGIEFKWSYGSSSKIYLYLDDETSITKIER